MHWAAEGGSKDAVEYLLENFSDQASAKDKKSLTPLHLAVQKEHKDIVKILCEYDEQIRDADDEKSWLINQKDNPGKIPFELATDSEIKILLKAPALSDKPAIDLLWQRLSTSRRYLTTSPLKSQTFKAVKNIVEVKNIQ